MFEEQLKYSSEKYPGISSELDFIQNISGNHWWPIITTNLCHFCKTQATYKNERLNREACTKCWSRINNGNFNFNKVVDIKESIRKNKSPNMRTLDEVIEFYSFNALDERDISRLIPYCNEEQAKKLKRVVGDKISFTRETILKELEEDLEFAFEKFIDERGLSTSCMYWVIHMWNWILNEGLEYLEDVSPRNLFLQTARKYQFNIPSKV